MRGNNSNDLIGISEKRRGNVKHFEVFLFIIVTKDDFACHQKYEMRK